MVTVDMPIVCLTDAAGLGVRGEVIPCAITLTTANASNSTADEIIAKDFFLQILVLINITLC